MDKQINIKETLDWYILAGVDEICGDMPCLISEKSSSHSSILQPSISSTPQRNIVSIVPASDALKNAKEVCLKASSLTELKELLLKFDGCNLKNTAASTILGDGNPHAKIMFIGEAPGADEDRLGKPFVGRCGKLLDKILAAINLKREDCYITNVLPWRPPGNRTPTDDEVALCLPFLKRQIELINPDFLVLLGGIALKSVMDCSDSISRTRGKWMSYMLSDKELQVIATYHPSYLLRSSAQKSKVWIDFLRLKKKIKEIEK